MEMSATEADMAGEANLSDTSFGDLCEYVFMRSTVTAAFRCDLAVAASFEDDLLSFFLKMPIMAEKPYR